MEKATSVEPEVAEPTPPAPLQPVEPCEALRQEINKYTWDTSIAYAVARSENSSCDPARHNETASETHRRADGSVICVGSYGAFQVGCLHYAPGEDVNDLATNVAIAYRVYESRSKWDSSGFNAWTMYTNGRYLEKL